jgi:hypothetical protein
MKTKKHIYLIILFFLFSSVQAFSQTDPKEVESALYNSILSAQVKTLNLNVQGYSMNTLGEMKDEFIKMEGKVISVVFDETAMLMEIKHNGFLPKDEVMKVLANYLILNSAIISYQ